jgi:hypothetical protein
VCNDIQLSESGNRTNSQSVKRTKYTYIPFRAQLHTLQFEFCIYAGSYIFSSIPPTLLHCLYPSVQSRESSVGIAMDYGLDGQSSNPSKGKTFFSNPQRPDQLLNPLILLSNEYLGLFLRR